MIKLAVQLIFGLVGDQVKLAILGTSQPFRGVHPDWVTRTVVIPKACDTFREYLDLATWRTKLVRLRIGSEIFKHDVWCFRHRKLVPTFGP